MNDDADFLGNKRSDYIVEQTVDKNGILIDVNFSLEEGDIIRGGLRPNPYCATVEAVSLSPLVVGWIQFVQMGWW